jgi:hypothetical protein
LAMSITSQVMIPAVGWEVKVVVQTGFRACARPAT